ncbi:MAG: hypothetical protein OQK04_18075, partial [Kangiellaceae bacterium]|nr:hypothetical protein [Kangiellaceae bacterium]
MNHNQQKKSMKGSSLKRLSIIASTVLGTTLASVGIQANSLNEQQAFFADTAYPHEINKDLRDLPLAKEWLPGEPIKLGPPRLLSDPVDLLAPVNPVQEVDFFKYLDAQSSISAKISTRALTNAVNNFDGIAFTGVNPADPTGEVGIKYYIQSINSQNGSSFSVYDKTNGNKVAGPTAMTSLGSIAGCSSGTLGDPIILFDEIAKRWLLTEFTDQTNKSLCVYVSKTQDPLTGGWYAYKFQA